MKVYPARTLRQEAAFVALVFLLPAVVAAVFPYGAFKYAPSEPAARGDASFAFVSLAPKVEKAVLSSVRSAWHTTGGSAVRRVEIPMDLPKMEEEMRIAASAVRKMPAMTPRPYLPCFLPGTVAAPRPSQIPVDALPAAQGDAFSREELMSLPEIQGGSR